MSSIFLSQGPLPGEEAFAFVNDYKLDKITHCSLYTQFFRLHR
jgi:hypothetical protein